MIDVPFVKSILVHSQFGSVEESVAECVEGADALFVYRGVILDELFRGNFCERCHDNVVRAVPLTRLFDLLGEGCGLPCSWGTENSILHTGYPFLCVIVFYQQACLFLFVFQRVESA